MPTSAGAAIGTVSKFSANQRKSCCSIEATDCALLVTATEQVVSAVPLPNSIIFDQISHDTQGIVHTLLSFFDYHFVPTS